MLEFKQARDAEFYNACKRIISKSKDPISIRVLISRALDTPATSFFISETRIARIIRAPESACPKSPAKAALFNMIKHLYFQEKMLHPDLSPESISRNIIFFHQPPRFYITPPTATDIYYTELNKRKTKGRD